MSGDWWIEPEPRPTGSGIPEPGSRVEWDRDEWDVTIADRATYRIFRDRATGAWFLDGMYD
jgi:hypothetical protein